MDNYAITNAIRRMVRGAVGKYQGPVRGEVVQQNKGANEYTVDVRVLNSADDADPFWPTIPRVEVPRFFFAGGETGVYCRIDEGTIVRVGFYEGDIHRPFLDAVLGIPGQSPDLGKISFMAKSPGAAFVITDNSVSAAAGFCGLFGSVRLGGAAKNAPPADAAGFKAMLGEEWQTVHNMHSHSCPLFGLSGVPTPPYLEETVFSQKVKVDR